MVATVTPKRKSSCAADKVKLQSSERCVTKLDRMLLWSGDLNSWRMARKRVCNV